MEYQNDLYCSLLANGANSRMDHGHNATIFNVQLLALVLTSAVGPLATNGLP